MIVPLPKVLPSRAFVLPCLYSSYSSGGRGVEFLMGYYPILDCTPKGRDEGNACQASRPGRYPEICLTFQALRLSVLPPERAVVEARGGGSGGRGPPRTGRP